jgi:radical SAM protein with 4Fe4S-binding SPASM domain
VKRPSLRNATLNGIRLLLQGRYSLSFDQIEFPMKKLSFRKRMNLVIQGLQLMMRTANRIGIPPILQLEPANVCNLNCLTCATGSGLMKREPAMMPFELYQEIINQVKDYVCLLVFWSWGEPFLHKDAVRMIRYAKDQGLLVHTSTNGHFFDARERAEEVVKSGLDSLIFAVDGLDQETYEKYRRHGDLRRVIKSIENVVAARSLAKSKYPIIVLRFIVMKHNEHQVSQVKGFAERLGVDIVTFRSAVVDRDEINVEEDIAPASVEFQQYMYKGSPSREHRVTRNDPYCHRPYANLTVFSNGEVVPCENDFNATMQFGNARDKSLREILSSAQNRFFLKKFSHNFDLIPLCQTCEHRDMKCHTANIKTIIINSKAYV